MEKTMVQPNELHPILMGTGAISVMKSNNSSPRAQMAINHTGQALVIEGCTPRRLHTGIEREFGKYTFNVKMPVDGKILKVLNKYKQTIGMDSISENPLTLIIYEDVYTKEVGIIEIKRFHCQHQYFGFNYVITEEGHKISQGSFVKKGTVLADSPSIDELKNWRYGIETNVAMMSVPSVIEDGVVVRRGFLEKLKTKGYETRTESFGKKRYPLNLYGTKDHYKPFPDIGDRIRDDGLLMAFREYDDILGALDMIPEALMQPDYMYDKLIYAKNGGKVIDIQVYHDINSGFYPTPENMVAQVDKYNTAARYFYQSIIDEHKRLKDPLNITPQFHRLLVEAYSFVNDQGNPKAQGKINYTYKRTPLDDYRVEISFEYDITPNIGFKITGTNGDKSVIVDIWEDDDMPVDSRGNRADIITDGDSTIKRMNLSRMYEQYINASSRDLSEDIRKDFGYEKNSTDFSRLKVMTMDSKLDKLYKSTFNKLLKYYNIISPMMKEKVDQLAVDPNYHKEHVNSIIKDGIYIWFPTNNPVNTVEMINKLRKEFPIEIGPVTYRGRSGNLVTTKSNVLIGSLYIMLLEKTGQDWSAVNSAKLQHFGIPAKLTNADKHSTPARNNPVRILGESEVRLFCSTVSGDVTTEILDQSNNPIAHKAIVSNILTAEKPTNINKVIDRTEIPRGKSRALVYMKHILQCAGVEFTNDGAI